MDVRQNAQVHAARSRDAGRRVIEHGLRSSAAREFGEAPRSYGVGWGAIARRACLVRWIAPRTHRVPGRTPDSSLTDYNTTIGAGPMAARIDNHPIRSPRIVRRQAVEAPQPVCCPVNNVPVRARKAPLSASRAVRPACVVAGLRRCAPRRASERPGLADRCVINGIAH